jgi:general secretion pathway protein N
MTRMVQRRWSDLETARPPRRNWHWVLAGLLVGGGLAALIHAPASWLADALASATDQRLLLADARGSIWSGSAIAVLTGGPGSRTASALPGRLKWTFGLARENRSRVEVRLRHACCIDDQVRLQLDPGIGRFRVALPPGQATLGRWPAAWLNGLGVPFNTVRPGGAVRLSGNGLSIETVRGRWRVSGSAELDVLDLSSGLSTLDTLGSYRLHMVGEDEAQDGARLTLSTLQGPLQLSGSGQWIGPKLRFRGEARADTGSEAMLNNLLNLLGQRRGASVLLAIG